MVILMQFDIYFNTFEIRNTVRRLVGEFLIVVVLLFNFWSVLLSYYQYLTVCLTELAVLDNLPYNKANRIFSISEYLAPNKKQ